MKDGFWNSGQWIMVPESGLWESTKEFHRPSAMAEEQSFTIPALKVGSSAEAVFCPASRIRPLWASDQSIADQ